MFLEHFSHSSTRLVCTKCLSYNSVLFNILSLTEGIVQYFGTPAKVTKHQKNAAAVGGKST